MSIEKIKLEDQPELEQMVTKEIDQIEKNLTVICNHIPINDKATLDILCHDNNGQLVIVQININEDDVMLLHGIQSLDYVDKFKSFLKATYNKNNINDKEKPRLILIAPSFSDAVKLAAQSMKGIQVDLYEWEYLKLGDHKGLRLQPIFTSNPHPEQPREEKPPEKKHEPKSTKKKETPPPEKIEEPQPEPSKEEFQEFQQEPIEEPKEPEKEEKKKLKFF